eukprot:3353947-Pyramimonas_sp.AAC.1
MADHMMRAARFAAWFFCQPSGGSAAQGWVCENELRACGLANIEATYEESVSYWTDWCSTESGAPTSILGTLPFAKTLRTFPVNATGAGQGARHSLFPQD